MTFVQVDATDFATPESAVSAATTIKIYGKLRANDTVYFVSSGAGSMTGGDIKHVGASATGIYTVALVKADLSDASAAWYDQYIIALSATGCARQTLVIDGGIDESAILAMSALLSDTHSAAILGASHASDAYSAALLIQSRLSDLDSRLASDFSDVVSQLTVVQSAASDAASAAAQVNSRVLLVQSRLSDLDSRLASDTSDIISGIAALSALVSDTHSAAGVGNSRMLLVQSRLSDLDSRLVSDISDLRSALSDAHSDLKSAIGAVSVTITASDISDIASAVVAALPITSAVSDIYSLLSDLNSNFHSRIPKEPAARSQLSDLASDLLSYLTGLSGMLSDTHSAAILGASHASDAYSAALIVQSRLSDLDSRLASDTSDLLSQLTVVQSMASDAASAAQQANSRVLINQSRISDVYSLLSDVSSDLAVMSDVLSNVDSVVRSPISASDISDIASRVMAFTLTAPTAVIGATPTVGDALAWVATMSRNKLTQTATKQTLYADNGTTVVASAVVSDDGTTATRNEFG